MLGKLSQGHLLGEIGDCQPLKQSLLVEGDLSGVVVLLLGKIGRVFPSSDALLALLQLFKLQVRLLLFQLDGGAATGPVGTFCGHLVIREGLLNQFGILDLRERLFFALLAFGAILFLF